jgi:HK97 gp10 family phage protein
MSEIRVKGLAELQAFLDKLPQKIETNIMRGALRAGAKPVLEAAKQNAPEGEPSDTNKRRYNLYSGALRDSLRLSARIDRRKGQVVARVVAGGKSKKSGADVFYAIMAEFGTKPHKIGSGEHPGVINPKSYMRPALDSEANSALFAVGDYIKNRLATRHGLYTADINIELEE